VTDELERIDCGNCGKKVRVEASGALRKHRDDDGTPCDGGMSIALPWMKPPLVQNDRQHWAAKAKAFAEVKSAARWAIRAARPRKLQAAEVTLHYRVPDDKVRDSDGPAPTLKAVLDALVDEGVLPADDWHHVPAVGVRIHPPRPRLPAALWVTLTPVPAAS
jgi:hypothetical protein